MLPYGAKCGTVRGKSSVRSRSFLILSNPIGPCSGLSNDILCILAVVQGAAKLLEVKVPGLK